MQQIKGRMDQPSLAALVPAFCSDKVPVGVCLPCCVTDCLTALLSQAVQLVTGLPNEVQKSSVYL